MESALNSATEHRHLVSCWNDSVLRITLNRPQEGNRVSDDMASTLREILDEGGADARIVVIDAEGADFCLGWQPSGDIGLAGAAEAYDLKSRFDTVFDCYGSFRRCKAPVVGLIRGRAWGFGCAIAGLCDMTIAADSASFRIPEMSHNIVPTMVMSSLYDRVGLKALTYLVCTTEAIGAAEAKSIGLVSAVVGESEFDKKAAEVIATLSERPPAGLHAVKEYLGSVSRMDPAAAVGFARNLHANVNSSSKMRP